MRVAIYNRRGNVVRYTEQRGALPKRVTLIEHDSGWTELERDAVIMLECHIANRGSWRPGDVETTPLTLSHIQHWLRKTYARRSGRDYARDVLATLVSMGLLEDTGQVLKPRRQPCHAEGHSYWWRIFRVLPISLLKTDLDLFYILNDPSQQGLLPIELAVAGPARSAIGAETLTSGAWRIGIEISGDNVRAKRRYVSFRFDGVWPVNVPTSHIWKAVGFAGPSRRPRKKPPKPEI